MPPPSGVGATFVPGGWDDYYMPEVVAPSPQRVTPQVPQNMQEDLQRMELEARDVNRPDDETTPAARHTREPSLSTWVQPSSDTTPQPQQQQQQQQRYAPSSTTRSADTDFESYHKSDPVAMPDGAGPSFSPFPKVKGDNVPPSDEDKEDILWNARQHVLGSQNVSMQITWARDVLNWAEICMEAAARENPDKPRPSTPRKEHELRVDALNIITYLAGQEHPAALYIRAKWLEFGKFGNRVDKREAYSGYKRAAELGNPRSEYRMGMLFEQSNDTSKAKEHYYKGLGLSDSASLYRLGMMSLLGQLGEVKDYNTGLERIKAAADSADEDSPQGAFVYGMLVGRELPDIYVPDSMLPPDPKTAFVYIEKSAYLGFAKAQHKMGQAYELCQFGCDFKPSYSLHYYGLAANQGNAEAALGVSRWFLFGYEGLFKKNEELAYKYAQRAAAQKLPTAEFAMGYYSEIGIHIDKSVSEAQRWYQLAAEHGNTDALGRLESLEQDQTLSKQDHETTTLTRIKSQHGSQRGKRPDRFKQAQQMPTLSEDSRGHPKPLKLDGHGPSPGVSPQPSPGLRPTVVNDPAAFPDPSRASVVVPVAGDRPPAFNVRLDGQQPQHQLPLRPHSAAPYPEDDRGYPQGGSRPKSAAPYPEDDMRGQGPPGGRPAYGPGPSADRTSSAFGINTQESCRRAKVLRATDSQVLVQRARRVATIRGTTMAARPPRHPTPSNSLEGDQLPDPFRLPEQPLAVVVALTLDIPNHHLSRATAALTHGFNIRRSRGYPVHQQKQAVPRQGTRGLAPSLLTWLVQAALEGREALLLGNTCLDPSRRPVRSQALHRQHRP
ncbi:Chitin synthase regulatory factor-like protein [Emericellopsis cladophorae]|uniref:Chitin synthase regulatory factor-like protein n=1 Tax=Emericellopsis cladophorae TaxID=2686198 RepID=A0A9P9XY36_9HYPO|nr:Chitin synthase regulatory factor-like protein [Emericellopsis cladophorae]KAI6779444.1 Chitin synthase regulatory factor-like protein [Emericellopsis cladophorae]